MWPINTLDVFIWHVTVYELLTFKHTWQTAVITDKATSGPSQENINIDCVTLHYLPLQNSWWRHLSSSVNVRDSNSIFVTNLVAACWYFTKWIAIFFVWSQYEANLSLYVSGNSETQVIRFSSIFQFKQWSNFNTPHTQHWRRHEQKMFEQTTNAVHSLVRQSSSPEILNVSDDSRLLWHSGISKSDYTDKAFAHKNIKGKTTPASPAN